MNQFSEYTKASFPALLDIFSQIGLLLSGFRNIIKEEVRVNADPAVPKLAWKYDIYAQITIYRMVDLAESIILCWENKKVAASYVTLRAFVESVALILETSFNMEQLIKERDYEQLKKLIDQRNFSTRLKDFLPHSAVNISTVIDKIDKIVPKLRYNYDMLCELTHPNHLALMGLYGDIPEIYRCKLSMHTAYNFQTARIIFNLLCSTLELSLAALVKFEDFGDELNRIEIEYKKIVNEQS